MIFDAQNFAYSLWMCAPPFPVPPCSASCSARLTSSTRSRYKWRKLLGSKWYEQFKERSMAAYQAMNQALATCVSVIDLAFMWRMADDQPLSAATTTAHDSLRRRRSSTRSRRSGHASCRGCASAGSCTRSSSTRLCAPGSRRSSRRTRTLGRWRSSLSRSRCVAAQSRCAESWCRPARTHELRLAHTESRDSRPARAACRCWLARSARARDRGARHRPCLDQRRT